MRDLLVVVGIIAAVLVVVYVACDIALDAIQQRKHDDALDRLRREAD